MPDLQTGPLVRSFPTVNISKRGGRRLLVLSNLRPSPDRTARGWRLSHLRAEVSCSAIRQSGWMTVTYRPPSEERRAVLLLAKAYPPASLAAVGASRGAVAVPDRRPPAGATICQRTFARQRAHGLAGGSIRIGATRRHTTSAIFAAVCSQHCGGQSECADSADPERLQSDLARDYASNGA